MLVMICSLYLNLESDLLAYALYSNMLFYSFLPFILIEPSSFSKTLSFLRQSVFSSLFPLSFRHQSDPLLSGYEPHSLIFSFVFYSCGLPLPLSSFLVSSLWSSSSTRLLKSSHSSCCSFPLICFDTLNFNQIFVFILLLFTSLVLVLPRHPSSSSPHLFVTLTFI